MIIYDKASWQLDKGMSKTRVIKHFSFIFDFLKQNDFLNENGLEIMDIGIDTSISLNDSLLNEKGNVFLAKYYDEMLELNGYNTKKNRAFLDNKLNEDDVSLLQNN